MGVESPPPAGAVAVEDWVGLGSPAPFRYFVSTWRVVDRPSSDQGLEVRVCGFQRPDGRVGHIAIHHIYADGSLTIAEARHLARVLTAAADEVQEMNERDYQVGGTS